MIQGFAGLIYCALPAGGTIVSVTRYNPDGTTTDVTAVTTTPDANLAKIDLALSALSQVGQYAFLVEAAASVYLGSVMVDVVAALANVTADITKVLGTSVTEGGAGRLAGAFTKWFDVAAPTGTVNSIPGATPGQDNGLLILGSNVTTQATSVHCSGVAVAVSLSSTGSESALQISSPDGNAVNISSNTSDAILVTASGASKDAIKLIPGAGGYGIEGTLSGAGIAPTANANADALLDRANGIETSLTPRQALRLIAAALAGELAIVGNTVTIRNVGDTVDRIVATTTLAGARTAVVTDVS